MITSLTFQPAEDMQRLHKKNNQSYRPCPPKSIRLSLPNSTSLFTNFEGRIVDIFLWDAHGCSHLITVVSFIVNDFRRQDPTPVLELLWSGVAVAIVAIVTSHNDLPIHLQSSSLSVRTRPITIIFFLLLAFPALILFSQGRDVFEDAGWGFRIINKQISLGGWTRRNVASFFLLMNFRGMGNNEGTNFDDQIFEIPNLYISSYVLVRGSYKGQLCCS